ncbi:MAG: glycerol-3-phosphate 1-O-acyltransferase PlsY [Acidobacteriota bacterium]|nr:glycerol-3-phosphate 1-O-acyltransferase PlsY [Acidobacteriota bacterium]
MALPATLRRRRIALANLVLIALVGYLLASFSSAVQISRLVYGTDIRKYGSGNAGATNMLRTFGWKPALAAFLVDVAKGFVPALLAPRFQLGELSLPPTSLQLVAGTAATIGHCYPLFAGFRGGKGVATAAGAFLAIYPLAVPICLVVFVVVVIPSGQVSLAALTASLSMPVTLLALRYGVDYPVSTPDLYVAVSLAGFIVFTHKSNISRMRVGGERRFRSLPW